MIESEHKLRAARWHRQKLHLVLSAMRHFAEELRERGMEVDYRRAPTRRPASARTARSRAVARPHSAGAYERLGGLTGVELVPARCSPATPTTSGRGPRSAGGCGWEDFYRHQRRRSAC